jgi:alcohol dehydrogenase class IV
MLLEASAMANLACGNSGLGLVHALSIATAVRLPHGYQNGVLLPAVAAFNYPFVSPDIQALIDRLAPLYDKIEFRPRFAHDDLDGTMVDAMVDVAFNSPLHINNVRHAGRRDLCEILVRAGAPVSESKQLTSETSPLEG